MKIGDRIRECRQGKGWTQTALAEKLGVSYALVSQYERGDRNPKIETIKKIADALDTTMDYLINGTEPIENIIFDAGTLAEYRTLKKKVNEMTANDSEKIRYFELHTKVGKAGVARTMSDIGGTASSAASDFTFRGKPLAELSAEELKEANLHFEEYLAEHLVKQGVDESNITFGKDGVETQNGNAAIFGEGIIVSGLTPEEQAIVVQTINTMAKALIEQRKDNHNDED